MKIKLKLRFVHEGEVKIKDMTKTLRKALKKKQKQAGKVKLSKVAPADLLAQARGEGPADRYIHGKKLQEEDKKRDIVTDKSTDEGIEVEDASVQNDKEKMTGDTVEVCDEWLRISSDFFMRPFLPLYMRYECFSTTRFVILSPNLVW